MFVIQTGKRHSGVEGQQQASRSAATPGFYVAISGEISGDPYGYGCEQDDDLDHSCWVWVGKQVFVIHFPRLDERTVL